MNTLGNLRFSASRLLAAAAFAACAALPLFAHAAGKPIVIGQETGLGCAD